MPRISKDNIRPIFRRRLREIRKSGISGQALRNVIHHEKTPLYLSRRGPFLSGYKSSRGSKLASLIFRSMTDETQDEYYQPKPIETTMKQKLNEALAPTHLHIMNESHKHNVPRGAETHFKVVVISDKFTDLTLLKVNFHHIPLLSPIKIHIETFNFILTFRDIKWSTVF